jgi:septum site-determining protein MinC
MKFKLRGTNIIAIELLLNDENFNINEIKRFIQEEKQLLKGARIVLSVENKALSKDELAELVDFVSSVEELTFCGFKTNLKENRELCIALNIPCDLSSLTLEREADVKFVKRTLRSGDRVVFSGDIVVMADVNPGAEIEAGGNVYVMGNLRGIVKAGVGKTSGEIRAYFFQAPRLELCGKELTFDRDEKFFNFRAKVKGDEIKLESSKTRGGNG